MPEQRIALWRTGSLALALATTTALVGTTGLARADVLVIANQAAFGGGLIETVDATTGTFVNSFVPDGAKLGTNNGRGVEVLGNFVYYTELTNGFGPTDFIRVANFNNGAGSGDIFQYPNPVPGTGVVDLAAAGGLVYAMTGYPAGPEVVQATNGSGVNVGPTVTLTTLTGANLTDSDGFTVLGNGNWLINDAMPSTATINIIPPPEPKSLARRFKLIMRVESAGVPQGSTMMLSWAGLHCISTAI
jgi:hypothetical protein